MIILFSEGHGIKSAITGNNAVIKVFENEVTLSEQASKQVISSII